MPSRVKRVGDVLVDVLAINPIAISVACGAHNPRAVHRDLLEELHAETVRLQMLPSRCGPLRHDILRELVGSRVPREWERCRRRHCKCWRAVNYDKNPARCATEACTERLQDVSSLAVMMRSLMCNMLCCFCLFAVYLKCCHNKHETSCT